MLHGLLPGPKILHKRNPATQSIAQKTPEKAQKSPSKAPFSSQYPTLVKPFTKGAHAPEYQVEIGHEEVNDQEFSQGGEVDLVAEI